LFGLSGGLFYEFGCVPLESFLACHAAKMVSFTLISYFEFSRVFVKNHAADWISEHIPFSLPQ